LPPEPYINPVNKNKMIALTSGIFTAAVQVNVAADLGGGAIGTYQAPINIPPGSALVGVNFNATIAGGTETGAINVKDSAGNNLTTSGVIGASGIKQVPAPAPPAPQPWPADGEVFIGVTGTLIHATSYIIVVEYIIANLP
jgi:hypothetical protein